MLVIQHLLVNGIHLSSLSRGPSATLLPTATNDSYIASVAKISLELCIVEGKGRVTQRSSLRLSSHFDLTLSSRPWAELAWPQIPLLSNRSHAALLLVLLQAHRPCTDVPAPCVTQIHCPTVLGLQVSFRSPTSLPSTPSGHWGFLPGLHKACQGAPELSPGLRGCYQPPNQHGAIRILRVPVYGLLLLQG